MAEPDAGDVEALTKALLSAQVPVDGWGRLYAGADGKMPLWDADDPDMQAVRSAVLPLLAEVRRDTAELRGAMEAMLANYSHSAGCAADDPHATEFCDCWRARAEEALAREEASRG